MTTPLPFTELRAQATQGPFNQEHVCDVIHIRGLTQEKAKGFTKDYRGIIATILDSGGVDAELITRLLNFAHAGGVEAMNDMQRIFSGKPILRKGWADSGSINEAACNALAILDGKAAQ